VLFVASILLFRLTHQRWWIFPVLLFVPDIFMLGYLRSTSVGAFLYNASASYGSATWVSTASPATD
jgi:hypothetical protein